MNPRGEREPGLSGGLSVFFPAYNDAPSLPSLVARTFEVLRRIAGDYEVIVVNDGSTDGTAETLAELQRRYHPHLRVVTHESNRGYGAALRSGFAAASKEFVFYTDGDGQYDPAELEKLVRRLGPGTGLVNGYKTARRDPWHRVAIGWLYNHFARWLFRIRLRDIDCDFRLIRRSALDLEALRSTGGAICVELVRSLELCGETVEVPVSHYSRIHGRSQFFRVGSLAVTLWELGTIFLRLVVWPALTRPPRPADQAAARPSRRLTVAVVAGVTVLAAVAYGWAFRLPFISDDYVQIQLARDYGPLEKWPALARDALYRCRATTLVLTYWIDSAAGLQPFYYNLASFFLHVVNALLVFALGSWKPVGWRLAALAAGVFAIGQRKSEAVVWISALPELLVFSFVLSGFLLFVRWQQSPRPSWVTYGGAFACFLLALASKESAVVLVPLCVVAVLFDSRRRFQRLWAVLPFALLAGGYFLLAYLARGAHLHFNDGTFSLDAPFLKVLARSAGGLLWIWGTLALAVLVATRARPWRPLVAIAGAWILFSLLPYSFLTYMIEVPSRHTYLASVGRSLLIAAGFLVLSQFAFQWRRQWVVPAVAAVFLTHQCVYLWTKKQRQYSQRAQPTEMLRTLGSTTDGPIYAKCFPYSPAVAEVALRLTTTPMTVLVTGPEAARHPQAVDFCNEDADGVHY